MHGSLIKTKELELKKQIILDEAAKLIDKVGFRNTKMEDIARRVGFSKASLYSYFKDKEEIALNIAVMHVRKFYNKISGLPQMNIPAPEKLEIMKNAHLEFVKRSRNLMTLRPNYSLMHEVHKDFIELKIRTFDILKSIIEQGKNDGIFNKDIDGDLTVRLLEAMFTGIVFLNAVIGSMKYDLAKKFNMEEMISFASDFFFLGITNTKQELCK